MADLGQKTKQGKDTRTYSHTQHVLKKFKCKLGINERHQLKANEITQNWDIRDWAFIDKSRERLTSRN